MTMYYLLFISDRTPHMIKAGKSIQSCFSKITHRTCITHVLHSVVEEMRGNFFNIDKLQIEKKNLEK